MAVRMNVLVLRPSGNGSKYHNQFDDVIGQLLGRPGLDVTLLERLPGPDESTTERLALESLGGHIGCLAWGEPEQVLADLKAAGKPMTRRAHKHDPQVPTNGAPQENESIAGRLFYFDMRRVDANRTIFEELQDLLKTLQTPMFQIGSAEPAAKPKAAVAMVQAPSPPMPSSPVPSPPTEPKPAAIAKSPIVDSESAASELDTSDDLDRLVDELDELDI